MAAPGRGSPVHPAGAGILAAVLRTGIPSVRHPERAGQPSWHTAWPVRGAAPAAHRVRTHDRCRSHDATCTARPDRRRQPAASVVPPQAATWVPQPAPECAKQARTVSSRERRPVPAICVRSPLSIQTSTRCTWITNRTASPVPSNSPIVARIVRTGTRSGSVVAMPAMCHRSWPAERHPGPARGRMKPLNFGSQAESQGPGGSDELAAARTGRCGHSIPASSGGFGTAGR